jgi:inosine-uridine nucleoside N-ribohydrolase
LVELHGVNTTGEMVVDHLQKLGLWPNVSIIESVNIEFYQKLLQETFDPDVIRS